MGAPSLWVVIPDKFYTFGGIHGGLGGVAPQIGGKRPRPGYRFAAALGGVRQELVLRVNTTSTYPADQRPIGRKNPRGRPPGGFL